MKTRHEHRNNNNTRPSGFLLEGEKKKATTKSHRNGEEKGRRKGRRTGRRRTERRYDEHPFLANMLQWDTFSRAHQLCPRLQPSGFQVWTHSYYRHPCAYACICISIRLLSRGPVLVTHYAKKRKMVYKMCNLTKKPYVCRQNPGGGQESYESVLLKRISICLSAPAV